MVQDEFRVLAEPISLALPVVRFLISRIAYRPPFSGGPVSERSANKNCRPCAERVTWTRRHKVITEQEGIDFNRSFGMNHSGQNWGNWRAKKPARSLT